MPELPEVQTVVNTLRPRVVGARIADVRLNRDDIVSPAVVDLGPLLVGQTIQSVDRRAKRIVFTLDNDDRFYVHLGMTGQLTVEPPDAEVRNHTHFVANLKAGSASTQLRFRDPRRFGGIFWLGGEPADKDLGPEPLTLRPGTLRKLLAATRRPIKSALLDQTMIAGIGNIYADEALFIAGVHPLTASSTLSIEQIGRLNRAIKQTLSRAIKARGSTLRDYVDADNEPGGYRAQHKVYGREGDRCTKCSATIVRIVLTGRSTCFCPKCQRDPTVR